MVENNIFVDCAAAVSFSPWPEKRWQEYVKSALDRKEIDRALYLERYPQLTNLTEKANVNRVSRNLTLRCAELLRRAPKTIEATNNIVVPEGELTLKADNPILNHPGFDRIPVEEIGFYTDAWRKR